MAINVVARRIFIGIGIVAVVIGLFIWVAPRTVVALAPQAFRSALAPLFLVQARVLPCTGPVPPTPPPLTTSDHKPDEAALARFIATLNDSHFDPTKSRRSADLFNYTDSKEGVKGRFIPIAGVCYYSQEDMYRGRIVGRVVLESGGKDTWRYADNVTLEAPGTYYILVDYNTRTTTTNPVPTHWRLTIVDHMGKVRHINNHMVYKSSYRHGKYDDIWGPEVGSECVAKGFFACMARTWEYAPKEFQVDQASQLWIACTQTGCCCSGSGCH